VHRRVGLYKLDWLSQYVKRPEAAGGEDQIVTRQISRSRVLGATGCLVALVLLTLGALQATTTLYLAEGRARAEATLRLTLQALDGHLRRYEAIPDLLADNDDIRALLQNPGDPAGRMAANLWLGQRNTQLDSSDIYVMTPDGVTIAASNHDRADSFIGQNFSYRPYFAAALDGRKGRFYAIGTTSGVRGYYFAAPVRQGSGAVVGVVAVKIGLDVIEAEWRAQEARIIVTDPEGIVFLATDPGWLYRSLLPLTPDRLARTAQSRRYADVSPTVLLHHLVQDGGLTLMTIDGSTGTSREFVVASQIMPRAGWTVQVLLDTAPFHTQARLTALAALMCLGAVLAVAVMVLQRRARLAERIALQEQAKVELERRVVARTADLARVNALIETEVTERRATEAELRRTQGDLVQAGKLAALGQMSAALSHEINQPLAAARNYADSAAILIDRGDTARARENVGQILSLIDRMAAIARHLRHVARKPDAPLQDITLADAMTEAVALVAPRLRAAGANVVINLPDNLPVVRGGPVRLQQVLVNILSNAADAVQDCDNRQVVVTAQVVGNRVALSIRDHGPGVPPAIADRIFDPFFTTKRVGSGLGLGLSISYNIMKDFGGDLRVANDPGGGAVFTLDLAIAAASSQAAE
jgi:two-component system, NtrC family, C4-dicarboxylate transport sensor histidine kinase DctB